MIDWEQAVKLATETDLTCGEIADRCGWPENRSLAKFAEMLKCRLPKKRRRALVTPGPAYRVRNVEIA